MTSPDAMIKLATRLDPVAVPTLRATVQDLVAVQASRTASLVFDEHPAPASSGGGFRSGVARVGCADGPGRQFWRTLRRNRRAPDPRGRFFSSSSAPAPPSRPSCRASSYPVNDRRFRGVSRTMTG
ncbi:hypothetical protein [Actinoplanes sp. NBRC 103695]|uniref:hypothetical protein n=1 Tax=Actinoplanes sp. NBRC 103695 TaxID=3032202 RepID=UPI0025527A7F|nr:hypothetical protein [Actinoplanes sp. NBRC 103695]